MVCPHLKRTYSREKYGKMWCGVQKGRVPENVVTMSQEWCMTQDRHLKCPWYHEGNGDSYNAQKWFKYWAKRGGT